MKVPNICDIHRIKMNISPNDSRYALTTRDPRIFDNVLIVFQSKTNHFIHIIGEHITIFIISRMDKYSIFQNKDDEHDYICILDDIIAREWQCVVFPSYKYTTANRYIDHTMHC
eukprot:390162_1